MTDRECVIAIANRLGFGHRHSELPAAEALLAEHVARATAARDEEIGRLKATLRRCVKGMDEALYCLASSTGEFGALCAALEEAKRLLGDA